METYSVHEIVEKIEKLNQLNESEISLLYWLCWGKEFREAYTILGFAENYARSLLTKIYTTLDIQADTNQKRSELVARYCDVVQELYPKREPVKKGEENKVKRVDLPPEPFKTSNEVGQENEVPYQEPVNRLDEGMERGNIEQSRSINRPEENTEGIEIGTPPPPPRLVMSVTRFIGLWFLIFIVYRLVTDVGFWAIVHIFSLGNITLEVSNPSYALYWFLRFFVF